MTRAVADGVAMTGNVDSAGNAKPAVIV